MIISTGLDPKSRQDLWKVINEAKQTSAVILTTHSMEEADAICDRLMIMNEGEIKCIGVSADLKNRYIHTNTIRKSTLLQLISFRLLTLLPLLLLIINYLLDLDKDLKYPSKYLEEKMIAPLMSLFASCSPTALLSTN